MLAYTIGIGFDGAETNCRIAHILGTALVLYAGGRPELMQAFMVGVSYSYGN